MRTYISRPLHTPLVMVRREKICPLCRANHFIGRNENLLPSRISETEIRLTNAAPKKKDLEIKVQNKVIKALRTTTDDSMLVIQYKDNIFDLFNIANGQKIATIQADQDEEVKQWRIVANSTIFSAKYSNGSIDLFDTRNGKKIVTIYQNKQIKKWFTIANNAIIVLQYEDNLFDLFYARNRQKINSSKGYVFGYKIKQNNTILRIRYQDYSIDLFDIKNERLIVQNIAAYSIRDNNLILIRKGNIFEFFNTQNFSQKTKIQVNPNKKIKLWNLLVNNTTFLVKYRDHSFDLFNMKNKKLLTKPFKNAINYSIKQNRTLRIQYQDKSIDHVDIASGAQVLFCYHEKHGFAYTNKKVAILTKVGKKEE